MSTRSVSRGLVVALALLATAAPVATAQTLTTYANNMPAGSADLEFDATGNLFVTGGSGGGGKIYKVPPGGGAASVFVASGLFWPWCLGFDPAGQLFVVDRGDPAVANSGRILKVSSAGVLTVFKSGLSGPFGLAFDPAGNLYVGIYAQHKVVKITPAGVQTDYASGLGVTGEQVMALSMDAVGNLHAGVEQDIYRIAPGGSPVTKVISGGLHEAIGHVHLGGDAFVVSTYGFHTLLAATPGGVSTLTSTAIGFCVDGPMPAGASVFNAAGLRMRDGRIYVADTGCHTVRSFDAMIPTPVVPMSWGRVKETYR